MGFAQGDHNLRLFLLYFDLGEPAKKTLAKTKTMTHSWGVDVEVEAVLAVVIPEQVGQEENARPVL